MGVPRGSVSLTRGSIWYLLATSYLIAFDPLESIYLYEVIWLLIEPVNKTRVSLEIQDVPYLYVLQSVINSWSMN